jgi:iron complex transport system substrate-binding protein
LGQHARERPDILQAATGVQSKPTLAGQIFHKHPLTHVFEVPLERVPLGSMRYGGAAGLLGLIDRLSLVTGLRAITTPSILQRIREGKTLEQYSTEMQLDREVDAVMGYYSSRGESLAMLKDRELGLNRVGMAEHLEPTPLAKSEWIKFFARLFNREKIANEKFDGIERSYNETRAKVQEKLARVSYRPKVLVNYRSGGVWQVFGGLNALAKLIEDAGGEYLFKDLPYGQSLYEKPFKPCMTRARKLMCGLSALIFHLSSPMANRVLMNT